MNLRDLQYLVALDEHRHFGRAAEACFVSQPTLSTQIRKLEEELGVQLVERTTRQVLPTPVGEEIITRARGILREAEQIRSTARRARDPEAGSLRLGIFPTLGPYLLPHVVPALHDRFPRLELLLVEEKTELVLERLQAGTLDAGILALPIAYEQFHEEYLFTEPFLLAVPASHHLAARKRIALGELAHEDLLLLEEGHCLRDQALAVCQLAGAGERRDFRATSLETLRQMVAAEVGITLLPTLALNPPVAHMDKVHLVRFSGEAPHRRIAMIWRKSSAHASFLREVAAVIRDLPPALLDAEATARRQREDA